MKLLTTILILTLLGTFAVGYYYYDYTTCNSCMSVDEFRETAPCTLKGIPCEQLKYNGDYRTWQPQQ